MIKRLFMMLLSGFTLSVQAQEAPQKVEFKTQEVASGLYMLSGKNGFTGGNLGVMVGQEAVVLIDDSMPQLLDNMQSSIKAVTDRPVDYVLNTHLHADHTGNNAAMHKSGAHVVAHENVRKRLIQKGITDGNEMKPTPQENLPVITFEQAINLYFNEQPMRVVHVPHAHTDGDSVIHFTRANVIHTGDVFFNGRFPFIDIDSGGSVAGMIAALETIEGMADNNTKIIPGHGELADKDALQKAIKMLKDSRDKIQLLIDQGLDEAATVDANPLADYHHNWNWNFITTERMVKQLYRGLTETDHHSH